MRRHVPATPFLHNDSLENSHHPRLLPAGSRPRSLARFRKACFLAVKMLAIVLFVASCGESATDLALSDHETLTSKALPGQDSATVQITKQQDEEKNPLKSGPAAPAEGWQGEWEWEADNGTSGTFTIQDSQAEISLANYGAATTVADIVGRTMHALWGGILSIDATLQEDTWIGTYAVQGTTGTITGVRPSDYPGSEPEPEPESESEPEPEPATVVGRVIFDSFESGDLSHAGNGFSWLGGSSRTVSSERAYSGAQSLQFTFGPDRSGRDSWAEQRFNIPALREMWFEYRIYIPSNYFHRKDRPDNNKFWKIAERHSGASVTALLEGRANGGGGTRARPMWGNPRDGVGSSSYGLRASESIVATSDRGRWVHFQFHLKVSDVGASNGVYRMWKNGNLIINGTGLSNGPRDHRRSRYLKGYLMGWANSGFSEETSIYIDDFAMYDHDPGWPK